jgi:hypothetical protein
MLSCCRILGMGDFKKFGSGTDPKMEQLFAASRQYQGSSVFLMNPVHDGACAKIIGKLRSVHVT